MSTTVQIVDAVGGAPEARPSTKPADQDLTRRLQAGSELAYREFVERYGTRIFCIAYGILADPGDAEEIAQRVVLRVFLKIVNFRGGCSLFSWVHRIAVNECYSMLRKKRRMVSLDTGPADSSLANQLQTRGNGAPHWDTVVLQRDYLNRILADIPEEDRQLLLLREVEGLSMSELAEAKGLNENAIRSRLFRARQRLRQVAAKLQPRYFPSRVRSG